VFEIKEAIKGYQNAIEFIFTSDYDTVNKYLFADEFPDVMPFLTIIDKTKKIPI
jgi:hypothetical protein